MRKLCCGAEGLQRLGRWGNRLGVPGEGEAKGAQVRARVPARVEGQAQARAAVSTVQEMAH